MTRLLLRLLLWTLPLSLAAVTGAQSAVVASSAPLAIDRELELPAVLACEVVTVSMTVRNTGAVAGAYTLVERLQTGLTLAWSDADGVLAGAELSWSGALGPGEARRHTYGLQMRAESPPRVLLGGTLLADGAPPIASETTLDQAKLVVALELVGGGTVFVGEERTLLLTVQNPLSRRVRVSLETLATPRLAILGGATDLDIPAGEAVAVEVLVRGVAEGDSLVRVTPYVCDAAAPVADPAALRVSIVPAPALPPVRQFTTVRVDVAAYDLPRLDGLLLVQHLPDGATYLPGSSALDGRPLPDPRSVDAALVFHLAGTTAGRLTFAVAHDRPIVVDEGHTGVVGLTPEPELLAGRSDALAIAVAAVPSAAAAAPAALAPAPLPEPGASDVPAPVAQEPVADLSERAPAEHEASAPATGAGAAEQRTGALFLDPPPGAVFRTRDRVTVSADTPLGATVTLTVDGELVSDDTVGTRVFDPNLERQTFDYVGVPLRVGPNELRVESVGVDGDTFVDVRTVYFAGPPVTVTATPVEPFHADGARPLLVDLTVADAWGHVPVDGFLTVEVDGSRPAAIDANPERAGYQVRLVDGAARLALEPASVPGRIALRVLVGGAFETHTLVVGSDARPWIVAGVASAGAAYDTTAGTVRMGAEAGFFARGGVFDDAVLTVAGTLPAGRLGGRQPAGSDPFPVVGSSGVVTSEARSAHGVYARLERDLSFLEYGDFDTGLQGVFIDPQRDLTGLSGEYHAEELELRAYAALVSGEAPRSVDLPSDGTSVRFVPEAPIVPGSLRVEVAKRDALGNVIPEDDGDPRTGRLAAGVDYQIDDEVGLLVLFRPVPQADELGRPYVLRLQYVLPEGPGSPRRLQAGAQVVVDLEPVALRVGIARETIGPSAFTSVISAGASADLGGLDADVEVAYGSDQDGGGVAAFARLRYQAGALAAEASWQHRDVDYRSAQVRSDAGAGDVVAARFGVTLTESLAVVIGGEVARGSGDPSWAYRGEGLANLRVRSFDAQLGMAVDGGAWYALVGGTIRDLFGSGSRVSVAHRQSLSVAAPSATEVVVSVPVIENVAVTLRDQVAWGVSNTLLVGLEAGLPHEGLLRGACEAVGCDLDPVVPLGTTTVTAQYEIPTGVSAGAGRVRLGLDTTLPVGAHVSLRGSVEQTLDLGGGEGITVVGLGARYDAERLDASLLYELRLEGPDVKHVARAGSTLAIDEDLFASASVTYVDEGARSGLGLSVAAAYRGDRFDLLTDHRAGFGAFAVGPDAVTGDTRATWSAHASFAVVAAHAYRWLPGERFIDATSLGASLDLWRGGTVTALGRLFHDWTAGEVTPGATIEASQRIGCGVYVVGGYNVGGFGRDDGAMFASPGPFVRLDVVFDENWSCGRSEVGERPVAARSGTRSE
ncbi:MAG: hypothetical protein ACNA8N_05950 [Trueperaceae bacterium]